MELFGDCSMGSADEYREYVEQCIVLASNCENPGDKVRLLQMAQAWRELADKLETESQATGKDSA
jgi:hypothetical protein